MVFLVDVAAVSALLVTQTPAAVTAPSQSMLPTAMAELDFPNAIMASRKGDRRLYVLLGSGFLRPFEAPGLDGFVRRWRTAHPTATITVISRDRSTNTLSHQQMEIDYIWIADKSTCLNVDLIAAGQFVGATMYDMVDNQRGLDELLKSSKMADARAQIAKERADRPEDRTERLISDSDYHLRLRQIDQAEAAARRGKLGIWSDAMKEEREAEGIR